MWTDDPPQAAVHELQALHSLTIQSCGASDCDQPGEKVIAVKQRVRLNALKMKVLRFIAMVALDSGVNQQRMIELIRTRRNHINMGQEYSTLSALTMFSSRESLSHYLHFQ